MFASDSQLYCLVLKHSRDETVTVGAVGEVYWEEGWLYYIGRSTRGWTSRARRLVNEDRSRHWHIDYLQTRDTAVMRRVYPFSLDPDRECDLASDLRERSSLDPLREGLGASDCSSGCTGHVLVGHEAPDEVFGRKVNPEFTPDGTVYYEAHLCRWDPL